MGCDIHAYIEIQNEDGSWYPKLARQTPNDSTYEECGPGYILDLYYRVDIDRNYAWFGVLAGVRNFSFAPVAENRGLPTDASSAIRLIRTEYGPDGHSTSWATAAEVRQALDTLRAFYTKRGEIDYTPTDIPTLAPNERLVFWFDN